MTERPPVSDWATGFDHLDRRFVTDPLSDLRPPASALPYRSHGPLPRRLDPDPLRRPRSNRPRPPALLVAHHPHHGSSRVTNRPRIPRPPITEDPPYHTDIRRILLPLFSPAVVAAYEPITRVIASELIDGFVDDGRCDAASAYAQHVPIKVITRMLRHPDGDHAQFRNWIHRLIEQSPSPGTAPTTPSSKSAATWLDTSIITASSSLTTSSPTSSRPAYPMGVLRTDEILGVCILLLLAGIDTTWSAIGSALVELPGFRRHVVVTDQAARLAA
ncbi:MAG: cytochrome P450 [Acidimicrobiia bacterium]|nr:cytochrome P450 [Acidimicrobiia bacterium]